MDRITIETELIKFLENNIVDESVKIMPDDALGDYGIDSYSIVEMILFIERRFGVIIPDEQLLPDNFRTVRALSEIVIQLM